MLCGDNLRHVAAESIKGDFASQLIDAASWPAGTRDSFFGVVSCEPRHQDAGVVGRTVYFSPERACSFARTCGATRSPTSGHRVSLFN